MKRKLIECIIDSDNLPDIEKRLRILNYPSPTMHKNTLWYKSLDNAEKTCIIANTIKKIHYKFNDGREMVEEYNLETKVMLRRAWKQQTKLDAEGKWLVEIGDPIPDMTHLEQAEIVESKDQPVVMRRNTRINLEWRIRNLPYPIETYCISANKEENCIIVRTTNKKYFKKLEVPELTRLNISVEQANISSCHRHNTLIITYKKPQTLLDMEKEWYEELSKIKPIQDLPNPDQCKAQ